MTESSTPPLSGPAVIGISATLGLVPRSPGRAVGPRNIVIVNGGPDRIVISRIACDPIQEKASGAVASGMLEADGRDRVALNSGETTTISVGGTLPSRPGAYVSNVRIHPDAGPPLVVPVTIEIAANPVWGIVCMLLGLGSLVVINTLAGESDVQAKLHDVLQFRQDANEWLERNPPPASLTATIDAFDLDVQRALAVIAGPRPRSVVDWRISSAADRQRAAENELKTIKDAVSRRPLGAAEVADLDDEWQDLQKRIAVLSARDETIPGQTEADLAGRLSAFLTGFKGRYLDVAGRAEMAGLGTQVSLVDLTLAAGRRDEARRLAVEVRRWLHRAAGDLDDRLRLVANYELMAGVLLEEDARIRQRATASGLPDDAQQSIIRMLDEATSRIAGDTPLSDLKNAFTAVLDVGNRLLKQRSDVMTSQVQAAVQAAAAETDLAPVEQAMAEDPPAPGAPQSAKIAFLRRVLDAWRGPLARADEATRRDMQTRIAAIEAALDSGDLKATSPLYREVMEAWTDYGLKKIRQAAKETAAAYCLTEGEDLRRSLAMTEANMQLVRDHQDLPSWEAAVDRIRVQALAIPQEDCLAQELRRKAGTFELETVGGSPLFGLQTDALALSQKVFTASLAEAPIGAADRLASAETSGVREAVDLARRLLAGERRLGIRPLTPKSDWYVGRPIRMLVDGLDSHWGAGVQVAFDFGDHSAPEVRPSEDALKEPFVHTYAAPLSARARVVAASGFREGSLEPSGDAMGGGALTLDIGVSPVSAARALADELVNARFGLALLISFLVYFWQFWAKERTFGSNSLDYVKAFALGVAAEAAVANLPSVLGEFALG